MDSSERFWRKVDRKLDDRDGCWPWNAARTTTIRKKRAHQYGLFWLDGKTRLAHVVAYDLSTGEPREPGTIMVHLCGNSLCCNPAHLRPMSSLDAAKYRRRREKGK